MEKRGHLFMPIVMVVGGLLAGYSAPLCALGGSDRVHADRAAAQVDAEGNGWRNVVEALVEGARNTVAVAVACAAAGIVIGVVTLTGIGIEFTQLVVALSQETLLIALMLTAIAGIVLGMGLPTTPAYIIKVGAARAGADQARRQTAGRSHVRLLLREPVDDHAAGRTCRVRGRRPGKADCGIQDGRRCKLGATGYIVPFMCVFEPDAAADRRGHERCSGRGHGDASE